MSQIVPLSSAHLDDETTTKREGVTNLSESFRMLDIFASCGAQSFVVNKLELEWPDHKKNIWGKHYSR